MNNIAKLLTFTLVVAAFFTSCNNADQSASAVSSDINLEETRGIKMMNLEGSQVAVSKENVIMVTQNANANADEDAISGIMNSLMAAENTAAQLDVNFTMSDEPVEEGVFVFGIETEEEKELNFQMFDEEGFSMAANNTVKVNKGNNYKALNVKSLDNGTYYFKLKDDAGKELTRKVKIDHKE